MASKTMEPPSKWRILSSKGTKLGVHRKVDGMKEFHVTPPCDLVVLSSGTSYRSTPSGLRSSGRPGKRYGSREYTNKVLSFRGPAAARQVCKRSTKNFQDGVVTKTPSKHCRKVNGTFVLDSVQRQTVYGPKEKLQKSMQPSRHYGHGTFHSLLCHMCPKMNRALKLLLTLHCAAKSSFLAPPASATQLASISDSCKQSLTGHYFVVLYIHVLDKPVARSSHKILSSFAGPLSANIKKSQYRKSTEEKQLRKRTSIICNIGHPTQSTH